MRLIDADAFVDKYINDIINNFMKGDFRNFKEIRIVIETLNNQPTIEAEPVKHGKWIGDDEIYPKCSECGEIGDYECDGTHKKSSYCPNCGAKMECEK